MLELQVVQAEFGDCLLVRYGTSTGNRSILVDGGPSGNYAAHLRGVLRDVAQAGLKLDLVVLSHIDNDHVKGLLDFFTELQDDAADPPAAARSGLPQVSELWHNTFSVSAGGADIAPRIREALATAGGGATRLRSLAGTLMGVGEGDALGVAALALGVPINARFDGGSVLLDDSPTVRMSGLRIDVLGPSTKSLGRLREEWLTWLAEHGRGVAAGRGLTAAAAIAADNTIPNLSSIVLLVRARGRSMLLTGDGRGDHIVDGMRERGLLPAEGGTFHVDLLKVPHHGSARNANEEFFATVTADRYVISANGRYGNPDLPCLISIVDAAAGRPIELVCTNKTDSLRDLVKQRPPKRHSYRITTMPPNANVMTVALD
jgi:hypothetical protein